MTAPPVLELRGILKRYPGVTALDHVDFALLAGEVHGLVGENGAGKSTLMKILAGAARADEGAVLIDGSPVRLGDPAAARQCGIGMIYQDLKLVPELSVAENLLLGAEPTRGATPFLDRRAMAAQARAALEQLGEELDPATPVGTLSVARRQIVEIARALTRRVRILALDEPTAALAEPEIVNLFRVLRRLRSEGVGVVYISHRLDEIFEIADRVTVLRDGNVVHSGPTSGVDRKTLVRLMVGRELRQEYPQVRLQRGEELLRVEGLGGPGLSAISFTLHRGEIVGLAGLVGAGRSELARVIFGAERRTSGRVLLEGRPIDPRSPREAIDLGLALLTEDRNRLGLVPGMTVKANMTLANLRELARGPFISARRETSAARRLVARLRIRPARVEAPVASLSGGNRQKVVLARWLHTRSKVLIFDEPTAGVDVGAKYEIYSQINELALGGTGVLVISSDLPELLGLCDRILVLSDGAVAGELTRAEATQERVMTLATGRGA